MEDEDDEDDNNDIKILEEGPRDESRSVEHKPPYETCRRGKRKCFGMPNRTCNPCMKSKSKCDKSSGRGGKGTMAKVVVSDGKGKGPGA